MQPARTFTKAQATTPALVLSTDLKPKPEKHTMKLVAFGLVLRDTLLPATRDENLESSRGRPRASRAL